MTIPFVCNHCGHAIDVDDRLAGAHGRCKHCGAPIVVPAPGARGDEGEGAAPVLRLRPLEGEEPARVPAHLLASPAPLTVRPAEPEPQPAPKAISQPDEHEVPEPHAGRGRPGSRAASADYSVLDPYRLTERHSSAGPPPFLVLLPSLIGRFAARHFRQARDWLYLVSLFFLVIVLLGYLFQWKILLHLGAVAVIAANIGMGVVGLAYLVSLPFREGLRYGLANLLIPFYAIYYWTTRWPKMKTPVYRTLGAFLPIALVGLAYAVYEEAPVVEKKFEQELPVLEKAIEQRLPALDQRASQVLAPLENPVPPAPAPRPPAPGKRRRPMPAPPAPPF